MAKSSLCEQIDSEIERVEEFYLSREVIPAQTIISNEYRHNQ